MQSGIRKGDLLQELQLLAQILLAAGSVSSTCLRQHRLPVVLLEPFSERLEGIVDIVLHTLGVSAGVVAVKVFVDVHDQIVRGTVRVLDVVQGSG